MIKNKYYVSTKTEQRGVYFYKFDAKTQRMNVNSMMVGNKDTSSWSSDITEDVIRVNRCVPATLGFIIKYSDDWPTTALKLIREYLLEEA